MASVLQQYHQLADRMATQITGSYQSWTDFLTTAARLYKYPYHEQLISCWWARKYSVTFTEEICSKRSEKLPG